MSNSPGIAEKKAPYTYLEAEEIANAYDQQVPLKVIVEDINNTFHGGKPVRSIRSIYYVVDKVENDSEWYERLHEVWIADLPPLKEVNHES